MVHIKEGARCVESCSLFFSQRETTLAERVCFTDRKMENVKKVCLLTHCSRETRKRVNGKQCRPRSDAAECGV